MNHPIYLAAKNNLTLLAVQLKNNHADDKPLVRACLNDSADSLFRDINRQACKGIISEKMASLYCNWLDLYTCKLHP